MGELRAKLESHAEEMTGKRKTSLTSSDIQVRVCYSNMYMY